MTLRRHSTDAGASWRKFSDPGYLAGKRYERRETLRYALTVWVWAIAIGAWLGIAVDVFAT